MIFGSTSSPPSRMDVTEAIRQMRDTSLMEAANIAYREAERAKTGCAETALIIADAIRNLMRDQR